MFSPPISGAQQPFLDKADITEDTRYISSPSIKNESPRPSLEKPKIALRRCLPIWEFLIHFVGIGSTVVLVWANYSERYWTDVDIDFTQNQTMIFNSLQIASKVHETIMVASLSFLALHYMRRFLLTPHGIPFGLLGSTYSSGSIYMLFQGHFWYNAFRNWKYAFFALLLLLICILSLFVGPFSAIIMIPSLDWYRLNDSMSGQNSTIYVHKNSTSLKPSVLTAADVEQAAVNSDMWCQSDPTDPTNDMCPDHGFIDVSRWLKGYSKGGAQGGLALRDSFSDAQRIPARESWTAIDVQDRQRTIGAYTTVPTELIMTTLGTFWNYLLQDSKSNLRTLSFPEIRMKPENPIYQPVLNVACRSSLMPNTGSSQEVKFPLVESLWSRSTSGQKDPYVLDAESQSDLMVNFSGGYSSFSFFKDDRPDSSSSLLALSMLPVNDNGQQAIAVVPCSIDARWAASDVLYQPLNSTAIRSNLSESFKQFVDSNKDPEDQNTDFNKRFGISEKPIDLHLDWANYLNYYWDGPLGNISVVNSFFWQVLENSNVGQIWSPTLPKSESDPQDLGSQLERFISLLLGAYVSDGIARTGGVGYAGPWLEVSQNDTDHNLKYLPALTMGNDSVTSISKSEFNESDWTSLTYETSRYGYGYGIRNTTAKVAVITLLVYCGVVVLHMLWVVLLWMSGRYRSSSAWGDVGNLIALAMNSEPTERLRGTSAGVGHRSTWTSIVRIRDVDDPHLQMIFSHEEEKGLIGDSVRLHKKYS